MFCFPCLNLLAYLLKTELNKPTLHEVALRRHRLAQVLQVLEPALENDVTLEVLELLHPAEDLARRPLGLDGRGSLGRVFGRRVSRQEHVFLPELAKVDLFELEQRKKLSSDLPSSRRTCSYGKSILPYRAALF